MEAAEFLQTHTKKNQAGNRKQDQILGFLEGSVFRMKPLKTATMQYEQLHYRNKEVKQVLDSSPSVPSAGIRSSAAELCTDVVQLFHLWVFQTHRSG